jgi:hypothetical protein
MSILGKIKKGVETSGSNKTKVLYTKDGSKSRVRFLSDMEDATEVIIHDSYDRGITAVCRQHFDEECPYCDDEDMRHRTAYVWSIWEHDAKEVKLFVGYPNNFSPLPALVGMCEAYGTLVDRDYVISQTGKGTNKQFSVVPMDKVKFKNSKAKAYSEEKLLDILSKAYPVNEADVVGNKNGKKKPKKRQEEPEDDDEDDDEDETDYTEMSPKELYMECVERGIKGVKKKQKAKYYITLLEKDDAKDGDDWEDEEEDEDDEW